MAGTIQIKRSANTATPTALEFGELAWSSNSQTISIGRQDGNTSNLVSIGGIRTPGTMNTEANITMTSTSTANLYNVNFRGSLKDSSGNKLEIYNSSGTKIWG